MVGRLQSIGAGGITDLPVNAPGLQVSAGAENHSLCVINRSRNRLNPLNLPIFHHQFRNLRLTDGQMLRIFKYISHPAAVGLLIRLSSQGMNCGPLGFIEHLRLDKGLVDHLSHLAAQRVQLPYQVAL